MILGGGCVVASSGSSARPDASPTPISFGLEVDGQIKSYGYGVKNGVCGAVDESPATSCCSASMQQPKGAWIGPYSKA